ncbi:MAG: short-chain dehydrogenase, partial [Acidimicrobiia bacterium]|nr:short-chain dehydrogenase [Acidimicrobiia bacterium]
PLVTWLASDQSGSVNGRVFDISGRAMSVAEGWHRGPTVAPVDDPGEIGPLVEQIVTEARPNADMSGNDEVN